MIYAHLKIDPLRFIGFTLVFGLAFSLALGFLLNQIFGWNFLISFIVTLIVFEIFMYFLLVLQADAKAKFVESVLPDALQLMASNLRSGLTTDRALLLSSRPEFGLFKDEIDIVGKEIATGKEVSTALSDMTKRIKSKTFDRAIGLIVSGLKSGGELAALLENTASDLRNQILIDKKVRSSVHMYVIFVFIAVGIGAPLLFGLSSFLVEVMKTNLSNIDVPEQVLRSTAISISVTSVTISTKFIMGYILSFLIATSILGGFIVGLIDKGSEKAGAKMIPLLIVLSLGVFFLVRTALVNVVGKFFS